MMELKFTLKQKKNVRRKQGSNMKSKDTLKLLTLIRIATNLEGINKRTEDCKSHKNNSTKKISEKDYELNNWWFNFQMRLAQTVCLIILLYFSYLKWGHV